MEENKILDWVRRHSSKLVLALVCLSGLIFFMDRSFNSKKTDAKKDFIAIRTLFEKVHQGEPLSLEAIHSAEAILSHHPQLHPKYDHLLALSFFQQENSAKGIFYAQTALQRAEKLTQSPYTQFGAITLLIADEKLTEALSQSEKLEASLEKDPSFETLRAFNLLRIAFLSKNLHQTDLEKKAWATVQTLSVFPSVAPLFAEGSFTLNDYFPST